MPARSASLSAARSAQRDEFLRDGVLGGAFDPALLDEVIDVLGRELGEHERRRVFSFALQDASPVTCLHAVEAHRLAARFRRCGLGLCEPIMDQQRERISQLRLRLGRVIGICCISLDLSSDSLCRRFVLALGRDLSPNSVFVE
jgi:hypothetical protein